MKFFTPMRIHRLSGGHVGGMVEWRAAWAAHNAHVAAVLPMLPRSVTALTKIDFHDCRIEQIEFISPGMVVLKLYGFKHYHAVRRGVQGRHWLTFKGVTQTNLTFGHLSAWWLYEEIDQADDRAELRVRLVEGKPNEISIRFRSVAVRTEPRARGC